MHIGRKWVLSPLTTSRMIHTQTSIGAPGQLAEPGLQALLGGQNGEWISLVGCVRMILQRVGATASYAWLLPAGFPPMVSHSLSVTEAGQSH